MRVHIPVKFRLMNRVWTVSITDALPKSVDGLTRYETAEILLRAGKDRTYTEHVFLHELSHAICGTLGWNQLNDNEGDIDALGGALHQFFQTKQGSLRSP